MKKSPTKACQELSNIVQEKNESALNFLMMKNDKVPDETVIREMSLAMSIDNERAAKFTSINKKC